MKTKNIVFFILFLFIVVCDQVTKLYFEFNYVLGQHESIIDGFFGFYYVLNPGSAFSFLAGAPDWFRKPILITIPLIALFIIYKLLSELKENDVLSSSMLALIAGGALGNLLDRIRIGSVTDFILFHWKDIYYYPAFNIADSAICVGAFYLLIEFFIKRKQPV